MKSFQHIIYKFMKPYTLHTEFFFQVEKLLFLVLKKYVFEKYFFLMWEVPHFFKAITYFLQKSNLKWIFFNPKDNTFSMYIEWY